MKHIVKLLAPILPSFISISDIKNLENYDAQTLGAFFKNVIYLNRFSNTHVAYHEAFHAVFNTMLKPSEQSQILKEGVVLLHSYLEANKIAFEDFIAPHKANPAYANLSKEDFDNVIVEEFLADEFAKHMNKPKFSYEKKYGSVVGKFLQKLYSLASAVRRLFVNESKLAGLFRKIENGSFAKQKIVNRNEDLTVKKVRIAYAFEEINTSEGIEYKPLFLEDSETKKWIVKMYHIYQKNASTFFKAGEYEQSDSFIQNFENFFIDLVHKQGHNSKLQFREFYPDFFTETSEQELTPFQLELLNVVGFNMNADDAESGFYNEDFLESVKEYHSIVNQINKTNAIDESEVDAAEDGVEGHYERWDRAPNQIDPLESLSQMARGFIYSLYYEINLPESEREYQSFAVSNKLNYTLPIITPLEINHAYYGALKVAGNSLNEEEGFLKLYELANPRERTYNSMVSEKTETIKQDNQNVKVLFQSLVRQYGINENSLAFGRVEFLPGTSSETKMMFRQILKAFMKFNIQMNYLNIKDSNAGKMKDGSPTDSEIYVNDANSNSAIEWQIKNWANAFDTILYKFLNPNPVEVSEVENSQKFKKAINSLAESYSSDINKLRALSVESDSELVNMFYDLVGNTKEVFERNIGVTLSANYIKYSLLREIKDSLQANKTDEGIVKYERFKRVFANDMMLLNSFNLEKDELLFSRFKKNSNTNFIYFINGVRDSTVKSNFFNNAHSAAKKGMRNVAKGNSYFDESISVSSYENGNGDKVFEYQEGSYALRFNVDLSGRSRHLAKKIKALAVGKSGTALYDKIKSAFSTEMMKKVEEGTISRIDLLRNGFLNLFDLDQVHKIALQNNLFLQNPEEISKILSDLESKNLADSHKEYLEYVRSMVVAFEQIRPFAKVEGIDSAKKTQGSGEGVLFKDMDERTYLLTMVNMLLDRSGSLGGVRFNRSNLGVNEASSTSHTITLPDLSNKLLITTEDGKVDLNYQLMQKLTSSIVESEFARIAHYLQQLKEGSKGVTKGFDSFTWEDVLKERHSNKKSRNIKSIRFTNDVLGIFDHAKMLEIENYLIDKIEDGGDISFSMIQGAVAKSSGDFINTFLDSFMQEMIDEKFLIPQKNGTYISNLLKLPHVVEAKQLAELKAVVFEDFIKMHYYNQLRFGDSAVTFKSTEVKNSDTWKRYRGAIGGTVSCSFRNADTNLFYEDYELEHFGLENSPTFSWETRKHLIFSEPKDEVLIWDANKNEYVVKEVEHADGQFIVTERGMQKILFGLGQLTPKQESILMDLRKGRAIPFEMLFGEEGLITRHEAINVLKLQGFEGDSYDKTAVEMITFENTVSNPDKRALYHVMRNGDIDIASPPSASKLKTRNIVNYDQIREWGKQISESPNGLNAGVYAKTDELVTYKDNDFLGKQTENPSNKITNSESTQMQNIVDNEIVDDDEISEIDGVSFIGPVYKALGTSLKTLRKAYQDLLSKRTDESFDQFQREFVERVGNLKFEDLTPSQINVKLDGLYDILKRSVEETGGNKQLIDFFEQIKFDATAADPNFPAVKNKIISMFNAMASKRIFKQKVDGYTATLVSDFGNVVTRKITRKKNAEGEYYFTFDVVTVKNTPTVKRKEDVDLSSLLYNWHASKTGRIPGERDYLKAVSSLFENEESEDEVTIYVKDRLRHNLPSVNDEGVITGFYSEAIMPAHFEEQHLHYEETGNVLQENNNVFATRIPAQDKHSAAALKIVDYAPTYQGSNIMVAREIIALSGADFGFHKLYCHRYSGYYREGIFYKWGEVKKGSYSLSDQFISYLIDTKKEFKTDFRIEFRKSNIFFQQRRLLTATGIVSQIDDIIRLNPSLFTSSDFLNQDGTFNLSIKNLDKFYSFMKRDSLVRLIDSKQRTNYNKASCRHNEKFKAFKLKYYKNKRPDILINLLQKYGYIEKIENQTPEEVFKSIENEFYKKHKGYLNNELLTAKILMLGSNSVQKQIGITPVSMTVLNEMQDESWTLPNGENLKLFFDGNKNLLQNKKVFPTHTILQRQNGKTANTTGAKNIGSAVNEATLAIARSKYLGSKANNINRDGEVVKRAYGFYLKRLAFTGKDVTRLFDVLSTFISIATDEAKEQINSRYGYTLDTVGAVISSVTHGLDPLVLTTALRLRSVQALIKGNREQIGNGNHVFDAVRNSNSTEKTSSLEEAFDKGLHDKEYYNQFGANTKSKVLDISRLRNYADTQEAENALVEFLKSKIDESEFDSFMLESSAGEEQSENEADNEETGLEVFDDSEEVEYDVKLNKNFNLDQLLDFLEKKNLNGFESNMYLIIRLAQLKPDLFYDPRMQALLFNPSFQEKRSDVIKYLLMERLDGIDTDVAQNLKARESQKKHTLFGQYEEERKIILHLLKSNGYDDYSHIVSYLSNRVTKKLYEKYSDMSRDHMSDIQSIKLTKGIPADDEGYTQMVERIGKSFFYAKTIGSYEKEKDKNKNLDNIKGILTNIKTFDKFKKIIEGVFVSANTSFTDKVAYLAEAGQGDKTYKPERIKKHFELFLYFLSFSEGARKGEFTGFSNYFAKDMDNFGYSLNNVEDLMRKIKESDKLSGSILDKSILFGQNKNIGTMNLQYGRNLSDKKKESLFDMLYTIDDSEIDILYDMMKYLIQKSAMSFERDNVGQVIPPMFFTSYNQSVGKVTKYFRGELSAEEVFGMESKHLEELFSNLYFSDVSTFNDGMLNMTRRLDEKSFKYDRGSDTFSYKMVNIQSTDKRVFPMFMKVNKFTDSEVDGKIKRVINETEKYSPILVKAFAFKIKESVVPIGDYGRLSASGLASFFNSGEIELLYRPVPLLGYNQQRISPITQISYEPNLKTWVMNKNKPAALVGRFKEREYEYSYLAKDYQFLTYTKQL
ncbi:hypothetical protein [Flectobacillus rivi]|uniref:Uncharacterized protein n=1 Tax=Flectobacillus rivi TaxID=2984209 RepID=A0ABT6YZN1_9BACT|nr:hypothetical protein [Flectobacillus rivi]MDI9873821.1 hypothetical protein [Flectobacillus rivi]